MIQIKFPDTSSLPAEDNFELKLVTSLDELEPYADEWDEMALNFPYRVPFLSYTWISAYLRYQLNDDEQWFCLFALDKQRLAGVLPVLASKERRMRKEFLRLRTPNNAHTLSVDFLCSSGNEQRVISIFIRFIGRIRPLVLSLDMKQLVAESPTLNALAGRVPGAWSNVYQYGMGMVIPVEGTLENYQEKLGGKYNKNIRRLNRKVESLNGYSFTEIWGHGEDPETFGRFAMVEGSGWKSEQGSSILANQQLQMFLKYLAERLSDKGWLHWHFISAEGTTLAAHMGIPFGDSYILYKIGYNEAFPSYSPGTVLFSKMISWIYRNNTYRAINCLSDSTWVRNWDPRRVPYYNLRISFMNVPSFLFGGLPVFCIVTVSKVRVLRKLYRKLKRKHE